MNAKTEWESDDFSGEHPSDSVMDGNEETCAPKRTRIDFNMLDDPMRLVGNVDVLRHEDTDTWYVCLNDSFLRSCRVLADSGQSLAPLFLQYRRFVDGMDGPGCGSGECRGRKEIRFDFSLADFGPFRRQPEYESGTGCGGLDDGQQDSQHECSDSEIYRFLVRHFGVVCPNTSLNDDFVASIEAFRRTEKMADFPFSKPLEFGRGPGKPFSLSRREDVGNHNRKVFEKITALRKEKNTLSYVKNPRFFEESSEDDEDGGNIYVMRENVGCAYYHDGRYVFFSNLVLRIFSRNGQIYINMRSGRKMVFRELDRTQASAVYNRGEDVVYILVMKTMMIYRLTCRHPHVALEIYRHMVGCEA